MNCRLLSLRLPARLVARADAIVTALRDRGHYDMDTGGDMSRSTVLRRALHLGLLELARQQGIAVRRAPGGDRDPDCDTLKS